MEITQWAILIALFSQCVPPLAFVIAELEGMPDRGAMLSLQNLTIFLSNNLKSCGVGGRGRKVVVAWMGFAGGTGM